jgi:hypothetical protein
MVDLVVSVTPESAIKHYRHRLNCEIVTSAPCNPYQRSRDPFTIESAWWCGWCGRELVGAELESLRAKWGV